ncbi:MAG: DJ-1/PfpI family protein [Bacteroidetes bacterium]|uniref:DJ-1/PfpI family protein n=1 Tax=Candidatus Caccoplasma merdipullorum TaxID=2840718 RepID=A0A9D9H357_9BACT|nr:DJ-1/PfpI family protein [Candidatus Caccoplasma merdipullorum]
MKKSFVFMAEGFEEIEALTVVDMLRRAAMPVSMVSITDEYDVQGAHGVTILADETISEADFSDAEWLILPGGMPGSSNLGACAPLAEILKAQNEAGGYIAAICAAPFVLGQNGILKGKRATCYPGFEDRLTGAEYTAAQVERDGNIITGNGPAQAISFAAAIIEKSLGAPTARRILEGMMRI